jgi:VWFA-related protein
MIFMERMYNFLDVKCPDTLDFRELQSNTMRVGGKRDAWPGANPQKNVSRKFGFPFMKSPRQMIQAAAAMLLAMASTGSAAWGQQGGAQGGTAGTQDSGQQKVPGRIVKNVTRVIVPVSVKDGAGQLVPDLRRNDFRILEDNVEQKITDFNADPAPLSVVILIDNDLKSKDAEQVATSLRSMVAALSLSDEAFVCRFDMYFHEGKGFIGDQDKLLKEFKRTELDTQPSVASPSSAINNGPIINGHSATGDAPNTAATTIIIKGQPTKALDDAVYQAAQLLKDRARGRRKIIFLLSDGINAPKFNKFKYSDVLKELLRNDIAVFSIGVGSAYFDRRFEHLSKYAHDTGGDVFYGLKSKAMEELYTRLTEEARNQYTIEYSPENTDNEETYHSIEVRVKREGLSVTARQGYYSGGAPR